MFDSILNELGSGAQTERFHQTVAMEFDGSRRHMQDFRDFLGIPSLGGELQHLTLALRELGRFVGRVAIPFDLGHQGGLVYGRR